MRTGALEFCFVTAGLAGVFGDVDTVEEDIAMGGFHERGQHPEGARFPRAIGSHDAEDFTGRYRQS